MRNLRNYFYQLMRKYLSLFILPQNTVVEIDATTCHLAGTLPNWRTTLLRREKLAENITQDQFVPINQLLDHPPDYLLISGMIHYERNIQSLLFAIHKLCNLETRLIITYYSSLWRPLATIATRFGIRDKQLEANWLAHEDVKNLLELEDFEVVKVDSKVLMPFYIPILSNFINRYLAPLPFFRMFCLVNILIARPLIRKYCQPPSVSIVVPARNEAGNIENILKRIPPMGPEDEIIFVEGNSTDNTWDIIKKVHLQFGTERNIVICQQLGKGKGDAVRKGFSLARNDILMILDADMTVPPEELPMFYNAIVSGKGEFINGSRLVYPMEKEAMRFFNIIGNKFFATAFSFVLGQRFKDTLCGTKVLTRKNYRKLSANRAYFGDFDPFGDFDLIFGASRMGLKIIEIPITYREREYGDTNISRWRHGAILLAMLIFSARRIKFI
jgi:hypothetical protein